MCKELLTPSNLITRQRLSSILTNGTMEAVTEALLLFEFSYKIKKTSDRLLSGHLLWNLISMAQVSGENMDVRVPTSEPLFWSTTLSKSHERSVAFTWVVMCLSKINLGAVAFVFYFNSTCDKYTRPRRFARSLDKFGSTTMTWQNLRNGVNIFFYCPQTKADILELLIYPILILRLQDKIRQ